MSPFIGKKLTVTRDMPAIVDLFSPENFSVNCHVPKSIV